MKASASTQVIKNHATHTMLQLTYSPFTRAKLKFKWKEYLCDDHNAQGISIIVISHQNKGRVIWKVIYSSSHTIAQKKSKVCKQSKCPAVRGWINLWHIYTMDYYAVKIKDEIMRFSALNIELDEIMLNKIRQGRVANAILSQTSMK